MVGSFKLFFPTNHHVNLHLLASIPDFPIIDVRPSGPVVEIPSIHTIDSLPTLIPSSLYSTDLGSSNMIVPAINDDNDNTTTPHDELQAYVKEPIIMWEDIQTQ